MYEEILDIAEDLFMRQGYNDTSTRQIAKILNITQPNIYYHFKNKEEIYFQVMKRLSTEVGKNLSDLSKKAGSFEARVTAMVFYLQERHPFSLFMMMHDIQHTLNPEIAKQLFSFWQESYKRPFLDLFNQEPKIRKSVEPEVAVRQLFILISANLESPEAVQKENMEKSIQLFFYGVLDN